MNRKAPVEMAAREHSTVQSQPKGRAKAAKGAKAGFGVVSLSSIRWRRGRQTRQTRGDKETNSASPWLTVRALECADWSALLENAGWPGRRQHG